MFKLILVVMACIILIPMYVQGRAYTRHRKAQKLIKIVSDEDAEKNAGKHVMIDGFNGPVVVSGDTPQEMYDKAFALYGHDRNALSRLVPLYIPRKDETLFGGRHYRPAQS